jgi:hypothetical protein
MNYSEFSAQVNNVLNYYSKLIFIKYLIYKQQKYDQTFLFWLLLIEQEVDLLYKYVPVCPHR